MQFLLSSRFLELTQLVRYLLLLFPPICILRLFVAAQSTLLPQVSSRTSLHPAHTSCFFPTASSC
jgi:hypothetical protein